jgi:hypothetical protein
LQKRVVLGFLHIVCVAFGEKEGTETVSEHDFLLLLLEVVFFCDRGTDFHHSAAQDYVSNFRKKLFFFG